MDRIEEYSFQKDVYSTLIKMVSYRTPSFIVGERKACNNDVVFFYRLLNDSDQLLGRAFRQGKMVATNTEYFLDNYKRVVKDDTAYLAFVHQEDLASLSDKLFEIMSTVDTRFKNMFDRYWKHKCLKSVKVLYYRYLITDSVAPKYDGLGPDTSKLMYCKIKEFVGIIKETLDSYVNLRPVQSMVIPPVETLISKPKTEPEPKSMPESDEHITQAPEIQISIKQEVELPLVYDEDEIRFLTYVYEKIVTPVFPASALLLSVLHSRSDFESEFFEKVFHMDVVDARREMGIGEVSAKEVIRLGEMMRRIVSHPGARNVFFNAEKAALAAPVIDRRLNSEHIRVYHSYQKFLESCEGSMVDFYLTVAGQSKETVKFQGLNHKASEALLDIFTGLLSDIDSYVNGDMSQPEMTFVPILFQLKLSDEQVEKIVRIAKQCGHYPVFTTLSFLIDKWTNDRQKEIIHHLLRTFNTTQIKDLDDLAKSLGLSRERVRQLREECLDLLSKYPQRFKGMGLLDSYKYEAQSEYDFNRIREEEEVDFSNEYITICIPKIDSEFVLLGDARKAMFRTISSSSRLYLVSKRVAEIFKFDRFLESVEEMLKEKRYYPFRDDLETFIKGQIQIDMPNEDFYSIVKECRQILQKGYPNNIINSQVYFPANSRKNIPNLIEDILREYNRPMTAEEICDELNKRYSDLELIPSKIGPNALRNGNIVAVSRTSTYALAEWNYTEKRGGTIRELAVEYLNSLIQPIAPLADICDYIAKFREGVKESSVKANLLAESSNRFTLYYKDELLYIGFSDHSFSDEFIPQEKRQGRRSFKDSIDYLEQFIKINGHFPYTSGVSEEEARLRRFYSVAKANQKKGALTEDEVARIEYIDTTYGHLNVKKERVSWDDHLERFVKYITDNESLPYPSSKDYAWYEENKALYDAGELDAAQESSFSFLVKVVSRMKVS